MSATSGSDRGVRSGDAPSRFEVTISALVPKSRGQPDGPLKLWTLRAHVPRAKGQHGISDHATEVGPPLGTAGLGDHGAKAELWCKHAEENAYAGSKRIPRLHCVVNPAGGKGKAKVVWEEEVRPMYEAAGCQFDVSCESTRSPSRRACQPREQQPMYASYRYRSASERHERLRCRIKTSVRHLRRLGRVLRRRDRTRASQRSRQPHEREGTQGLERDPNRACSLRQR